MSDRWNDLIEKVGERFTEIKEHARGPVIAAGNCSVTWVDAIKRRFASLGATHKLWSMTALMGVLGTFCFWTGLYLLVVKAYRYGRSKHAQKHESFSNVGGVLQFITLVTSLGGLMFGSLSLAEGTKAFVLCSSLVNALDHMISRLRGTPKRHNKSVVAMTAPLSEDEIKVQTTQLARISLCRKLATRVNPSSDELNLMIAVIHEWLKTQGAGANESLNREWLAWIDTNTEVKVSPIEKWDTVGLFNSSLGYFQPRLLEIADDLEQHMKKIDPLEVVSDGIRTAKTNTEELKQVDGWSVSQTLATCLLIFFIVVGFGAYWLGIRSLKRESGGKRNRQALRDAKVSRIEQKTSAPRARQHTRGHARAVDDVPDIRLLAQKNRMKPDAYEALLDIMAYNTSKDVIHDVKFNFDVEVPTLVDEYANYMLPSALRQIDYDSSDYKSMDYYRSILQYMVDLGKFDDTYILPTPSDSGVWKRYHAAVTAEDIDDFRNMTRENEILYKDFIASNPKAKVIFGPRTLLERVDTFLTNNKHVGFNKAGIVNTLALPGKQLEELARKYKADIVTITNNQAYHEPKRMFTNQDMADREREEEDLERIHGESAKVESPKLISVEERSKQKIARSEKRKLARQAKKNLKTPTPPVQSAAVAPSTPQKGVGGAPAESAGKTAAKSSDKGSKVVEKSEVQIADKATGDCKEVAPVKEAPIAQPQKPKLKVPLVTAGKLNEGGNQQMRSRVGEIRKEIGQMKGKESSSPGMFDFNDAVSKSVLRVTIADEVSTAFVARNPNNLFMCRHGIPSSVNLTVGKMVKFDSIMYWKENAWSEHLGLNLKCVYIGSGSLDDDIVCFAPGVLTKGLPMQFALQDGQVDEHVIVPGFNAQKGGIWGCSIGTLTNIPKGKNPDRELHYKSKTVNGFSGAPLIAYTGQQYVVVGMHTRGFAATDPEAKNKAIPAFILRAIGKSLN